MESVLLSIAFFAPLADFGAANNNRHRDAEIQRKAETEFQKLCSSASLCRILRFGYGQRLRRVICESLLPWSFSAAAEEGVALLALVWET